jgi:hypothetical protein
VLPPHLNFYGPEEDCRDVGAVPNQTFQLSTVSGVQGEDVYHRVEKSYAFSSGACHEVHVAAPGASKRNELH